MLNARFVLFLTAMLLSASPGWSDVVRYEFVAVGDAGNAADMTGFGAVPYEYQLGKYEVSIGQYTTFLNSVDPDGANPYGLYNASMEVDANIAGISYKSESSTGQKYRVIGSANRPITCVSWFDAARFTNWMHNGQGWGGTETGAYTLVGGQTSGPAPAKNADARFSVPSENEWYKAAFYSPLLNFGVGGYFTFATQNDSAPGNVIGPGTNQANYRRTGDGAGGDQSNDDVYSVTQSSVYDQNQNYLSDVGAFGNSGSYYGTFDQSGNVWEWNDLTGVLGTSRGLRGGGWNLSAYNLTSASRGSLLTATEDSRIGFRLSATTVAVPEPTMWSVGAVGLALAVWKAGRRRKI
jgi:sulfatase modifying factor 1